MYNVTHNKKGLKNNYCGPAALSAIAGITSEQAATLLRHIGGRRAICTTYDREMLGALRKLGLKIDIVRPCKDPFKKSISIKRWTSSAGNKPQGRRLLVLLSTHYICVQGGKFWDNDNMTGEPLNKIPRKQVYSVWVITGRVNKKIIKELENTKKKKAKETINYRNKVKDLCKKNNCELKIIGGYIEIILPKGKVMYDGCHYIEDDRSNWDSAAEMWEHAFNKLDPLEDCNCFESCRV